MFMVNVRKYTIPGCYGNGIVVYHVPSFFIQQTAPDIATLGLGWVCFGTPKRTKLKTGQNRKKMESHGCFAITVKGTKPKPMEISLFLLFDAFCLPSSSLPRGNRLILAGIGIQTWRHEPFFYFLLGMVGVDLFDV